MATAPDRYPLHDTNDTNSATLPTTYSLNGFPGSSVADARATNALLRSNGGWVKYNDFTLVRAEDAHNSSNAYRLTVTNLGWATGAGLGPLSPTTRPAYIVRGNVIRFRDSFLVDAGLDPITFTASMRTWVYCDADGVVRIDVVALATPAAPAVGEFTVVGVDTNATDITANVTSSSPEYELHFTGPDFAFDSPVQFDTLSANAGTFLRFTSGGNADTLPSLEATATVGAHSLLVTGNGVQTAAEIIGGAAGGLLVTGSSGAVASLRATSGGVRPAISGVNTSSGDGIYGQSLTTGAGVRGVSGNTTDAGVVGESAASAVSIGVDGAAKHADAFGVVGRGFTGATTSSSAVIGVAPSNGRAVSGSADSGHAGYFESRVAAPTRSAIHLVPQNADPTTPAAGNMFCASARGNKFRIYQGTQHESLHSSPKGYIFAAAGNADLVALVGASGNLASVTITPEQTGASVLLTASIFVEPSTDTMVTTMNIVDTTAAITVESEIFRAKDVDGVGVRGESCVLRAVYALPSAAARTFVITLSTGAAADIHAIVLSVQGSL